MFLLSFVLLHLEFLFLAHSCIYYNIVIGYIDVDWSALNEGASAIVKELLPPAFDRYSNPNISNETVVIERIL